MGYSQNNEEAIIATYFGDQVGTFLDIGINDGITLSNTYALHLKGWVGVGVEASPLAVERCRELYQHDQQIQIIHAALTTYNGEITLHESGEHLGKGDVSLLSTVVEHEKQRWIGQHYDAVKVPAINCATMFGLSKYKQFDFISIDIEGMELNILPGIDLKHVGCKLLCVEYNGKDQHLYDAIILPQGYTLIHRNGENLLYAITT